MTAIFETVLLLAGAALAVWAVIAGLVYAGSARRAKRYRPGRPFAFAPVWFLAAPERQAAAAGRRELTGSDVPAAITTGLAAEETQTAGQGETGGASDRW